MKNLNLSDQTGREKEIVKVQRKVTLTRKFSFSAAHNLLNYDGDCKNLHGHTWKFKVYITGYVNPETDMVLDFKTIKSTIDDIVEEKLDHKYLNESIGDGIKNPTAENIVYWLYREIGLRLIPIGRTLPSPLILEKIELWESDNSSCIIHKDDFNQLTEWFGEIT